MRKWIILLWVLGVAGILAASQAYAESWDEFVKLKKRNETPRLIPKGGVKPRLLRKDIVIREIKQTGQINTGPVATGSGDRQDLTSEALLFEYGLPVLRPVPQNDQNIRTIAAAIKQLGKEYPHYFVDGHTCDIGSDANNCRLSWARARTVYDRLVQEGVDPQALTMRGFGENPSTTAVPNTSEDNRRMNRRVVLIAYGSGPGSRWPNKDIGVAEGQRPTSGTSAPTDDKERYRCTEGASYSSASSSGGPTSVQPYSDESVAATEDPGYWEDSDRLQVAATELMRQADAAEASGDHEAAETLRIKADELQGESWAAVKGMKAAQKKRIPQGFKPMQRKTPMIKGQSQPATSEQPKIPQGFKPMRGTQ